MDILAAVGPVLAAVSILIGVYVFRRQMNAQLFVEYTKRYEQVMLSYPEGLRDTRLDSMGVPPPESPELTVAILRYLNLCSEEFYLWERGYLSGDIWRIWESEIRRTLASPLYRREWRKVQAEFASYGEFAKYVADAQRTVVQLVA
jgi:hypothetical protein